MQAGGGAGGSLALLANFKLPLPGKVTAAGPSAASAWLASPPLRMDIISRIMEEAVEICSLGM